jgi:hypothetical protein
MILTWKRGNCEHGGLGITGLQRMKNCPMGEG